MPSETQYLIALSGIPELGPARIKKLLEHFGSAEEIWKAGSEKLSVAEGIGEKLASHIKRSRQADPGSIRTEFDGGIKAISISDSSYPKRLLNIYDPPAVLYIKGEILPEDSVCIAVVGTRNPSSYGRDMTRALVKDLAQAGVTIVSGLAIGIDSFAHQAAVEAGGRTIAVLGTGIKKIYPSQNRGLAEKLISSGALVCEYYEVAEIDKWAFPKRNRIISGLSMGTLVIEGSSDSGSLITAGFAVEQDRDVFALPGQIDRDLSRAPNALIKQGAKLVENAGDILEELNIIPVSANNSSVVAMDRLSEDEKLIMEIIAFEPAHIDAIASRSSRPIPEIIFILSNLIFKSAAKELPGKYFYRT
ncbi:MAG: DNA-processing protein DprA [Candidatus Saganbacteria bacterium]|nr:DNA-processing protein DprA [Candidatus Saganbacteria bacterium]